MAGAEPSQATSWEMERNFEETYLSSTNGPDAERSEHTSGSEQKQRSPSKFVDHEAHSQCNSKVDDLQNTVDFELLLLLCDSDSIQDISDVVRHKTVA